MKATESMNALLSAGKEIALLRAENQRLREACRLALDCFGDRIDNCTSAVKEDAATAALCAALNGGEE